METKSARRGSAVTALSALAILTFAAVLLAPPTRRIAREQVACMLPGERPPLPALNHLYGELPGYGPSENERAFAASHPAAVAVQINLAIRQATGAPSTNWCYQYFRSLTPLMDRYPRRAVVRAAVVRYGSSLCFVHSPATADDWTLFDRAVSEGRRLEPDNAFFPTMNAIGLHQRGRESEATESLLRAGRLNIWDDHTREEVEANWRLSEAGDPIPDGFNRTLLADSTLFPHYAGMRGFARTGLERALALEASGQALQGLAIRHALMRTGSLMRSQATALIGNLVGAAIVDEASKGPSGAAYEPREGQRNVARELAYEKYLSDIGQPAERNFAHGQFEADEAVRSLLRTSEINGDPFSAFKPVRSWPLALLLLDCATLMFLCAVIAAVLARLGWADPRHRISWPQRILATLASAAAILLPVAWQCQRLVELARVGQNVFPHLLEPNPFLPLVVVALLLAVPVVLKLVLIAGALARRESITAAVVSGFQRLALPIAAIMLLCYCGVLVNLARNDRVMADTITMRVQHEGRYYAHLADKQWPG